MKAIKIFCITILFLGIVVGAPSRAYGQGGDYQTHTVYIWNFTKYIQWPASYQNGDYVIGVIGNSPIVPKLKGLAATKKVVGAQKIVIKQFKTVASMDKNCHMIYVTTSESRNLAAIKKFFDGKSALIITEKTGLARQGSCINFVLRDGSWRFEMNKTETDKAGLKVSKQLTRLATIIE